MNNTIKRHVTLAFSLHAMCFTMYAKAESQQTSFSVTQKEVDFDIISGSELGPQLNEFLKERDPVEKELIGRGYDTVLGQVKRIKCVELESSTSPLPSLVPTPDVTYRLTKVTDEFQYTTATELNAAAAYNWGGGGADARAQYLSSGKLTSYNTYAIQEVDVAYKEQSHNYDNFHLNKYAKDLLKLTGGASII